MKIRRVQAVGIVVDEAHLEQLCQVCGREFSELPQLRKRKHPENNTAPLHVEGTQHHISALPMAHTEVCSFVCADCETQFSVCCFVQVRQWLASFDDCCVEVGMTCLLYTSPSPRDRQKSRMPSSA